MSDHSKVKTPLSRLLGALIGIWFLLGCLPIFVTTFYNFVPSTKWTSMSGLAGVVAGLASAALMIWIMLKAPPDVSTSDMKRKVAILGAPIFGYALGKDLVVVAVPMILAMIVGHQVELPFTVERASDYGSRRCRSPVVFQGLPFVFNKVCGISDDFRQRVTPGSRVVVIGRGTSLGVYAESLRAF